MRKTTFTLIVALLFAALANCFGQTYNLAAGSITTCSGTFYDSQGPGANYLSSENKTETFTSSSGQALQFSFYSFHTQLGNDLLTIYDGPNTSSPVIGVFSGVGSPGTITSTTASLTFKFTSTSSVNYDGWAASIICVALPTTYNMTNTSISMCSGLFYDHNGSASNYSNNENYTETFSSSGSNCLQVVFYSFSLASGDTLSIYDGVNTSSPIIGKYYSGNSPSTQIKMVSSSGSLTFKFTSNSSTVNSGWQAALSCTNCPPPLAASPTYLQPTTGLQNTYCGANMVNTCNATIADDGGFTSNYSNNFGVGTLNGIYRTFCPSTANSCERISFYEIKIDGGTDIGGNHDKLVIQNGPTAYALPFANGNNLYNINCTSYDQCMGLGKGPWVSYDQSGCITIAFQSNNDGVTAAGWKAVLDCVPCANTQTGLLNNDCVNAVPICSNTNFADASTGPGLTSEGDPTLGCVVSENYTNWFQFTIQSSGTLGFTISPTSTGVSGDDYDFSLFGPSTTCGSLGAPIRCSYAWSNVSSNPTNTTGISSSTNSTFNDGAAICGGNNSGSDISETVCGNSWVDDLPVTAGEVYYLMVNKWSAGGNGYTLNWNLTNGASLQCPLLPVTLTSFTCAPESGMMTLDWISQSEINNDHYLLEKSSDGENFSEFTTVPGKGTSSLSSEYFITDNHPFPGVNYYRLSQVDKNGFETKLQTTSCTYSNPNEEVTLNIFDLSGRLIYTTKILASDYNQTIHSVDIPQGVYVTALMYSNGSADLSKFLKL